MAGKISVERKTARILAAFLAVEGGVVAYYCAAHGAKFLAYLGLAAGRQGTVAGWLLALLVTAIFVAYSARFPSVRANLVKPSWLKLLALPMALAAGVLEEAVFRGTLMTLLQHRGADVAVQVLVSGLAFGAAHGIWGLFGKSMRAAFGATAATGALGLALAAVYVVAGRSLLPCIAAHTLIDAFIEPGMVLAVCRGEFRRLGAARAT
jgi:membrane protease YdiL (CAAX protease family)